MRVSPLSPLNATCRNIARRATNIIPIISVSHSQFRSASSNAQKNSANGSSQRGRQRTQAQDMESYETRIREAARIRDLANASLSRPPVYSSSSSSPSSSTSSSWDQTIRETTSSVEVMRDIIAQFPTRDAIARVAAERPFDDALAGDDKRQRVTAVADSISELGIDPRRVSHFAPGNVYQPSQFALTADPRAIAAGKFYGDRFKLIGRSPLEFYKDAHFLSEFVSPMGQIYAREITGLSRKNHRFVVRAIKRARAAGLLSTVHRAITRLQY
ncbi:mitochondrial 37S ribosomal protein bS18m [Lipomyces chichibuensis]|uniref:mitochondrial 37S ribosomal protein bS18m n=1 Tax=Lipomyces chichibuensis TaxID=1546026 RepID=UPI0033440CA6